MVLAYIVSQGGYRPNVAVLLYPTQAGSNALRALRFCRYAPGEGGSVD